jgi:hypothetical protein
VSTNARTEDGAFPIGACRETARPYRHQFQSRVSASRAVVAALLLFYGFAGFSGCGWLVNFESGGHGDARLSEREGYWSALAVFTTSVAGALRLAAND